MATSREDREAMRVRDVAHQPVDAAVERLKDTIAPDDRAAIEERDRAVEPVARRKRELGM
jgi:hypothetical protein